MMPKIFFLTILISFLLSLSGFVLANGELSYKSEIVEGKRLTESKISCAKLSDEQLEAIGEYLMEQMYPGESHEAMHKMIGMEEGTEHHKKFHINIAKMMYCGQMGMIGEMMSMMMGGGMMGNWSSPSEFNFNNPMMNMIPMMNYSWWDSLGWFGWIFMIFFWILVILGAVFLIKWLIEQLTGARKEKSALDILKERYAKGEISKEEFEEKKKDLV